MITRIVKIETQPGRRKEFIALFETVACEIKKSSGCLKVHLLKDIADDNIVFTISMWQTAADLDNYRKSALFSKVWPEVKLLFAEKAEAWSLEELI